MREDFLVFGSPMIGEAEIAEVVDSLRSGWIGTGPKVQRFEGMLSEYLGAAHCRCVSSCTAALILSLRVLGIGPGDEVLVPAMTFVASANAVEHAGATPVLVDSEPRHRADRSRPGRGGDQPRVPRRSCPCTWRAVRSTWTAWLDRGTSTTCW